jgi:hypothetical protein
VDPDDLGQFVSTNDLAQVADDPRVQLATAIDYCFIVCYQDTPFKYVRYFAVSFG